MKAVAIWFVLSALVFSDFIQITVAESPEGVKEGESHENADPKVVTAAVPTSVANVNDDVAIYKKFLNKEENLTGAKKFCYENFNGDLLALSGLNLTLNESLSSLTGWIGLSLSNFTFRWYDNETALEILKCFTEPKLMHRHCLFLECGSPSPLSCLDKTCENCTRILTDFLACVKVTPTSTVTSLTASSVNPGSTERGQPRSTTPLVTQPISITTGSESSITSRKMSEANAVTSTITPTKTTVFETEPIIQDSTMVTSAPKIESSKTGRVTCLSTELLSSTEVTSSGEVTSSTEVTSSAEVREVSSTATTSETTPPFSPTPSRLPSSKVTVSTSDLTTTETPKSEIENKLDQINVSDKNALEKIVNVTSSFIVKKKTSNQTTTSLAVIALALEEKLVEFAWANLQNGSVERETKELYIFMTDLTQTRKLKDVLTFPPNSDDHNASRAEFVKIPLNFSSLENRSVFVGIIYNNSQDTNDIPQSGPDNSTQSKLISRLISAEIDPKPSEDFGDITFTLAHGNISREKVYCAFIDKSQLFSERGCSKVTSNETHTLCTCNHMTSFALITKIKEQQFTDDSNHRMALGIITYIGITFSLVGEILTVASYVFLIGLKTEQAHLHTNLAFSLGLAQTFFLLVITSVANKVACLLITSLIHYFYLVTFCWMLMEGFHLYLMVVKVFTENTYLKLYYAFSWITPLVPVILALIVSAASSTGIYGYVSNKDVCWISYENNYIWFFLGPVMLICLANFVMLVLVVREMTAMNKTKAGGHALQFRKSVKACLLLFPILGTTWIFSILLMIQYSLAFEYIFNILNSFQGFFIFLFYVLRSTEIRGVLQQRKSRWVNSLDVSNHVSIYQKTPSNSRKTQPASISAIRPILGSWFLPSSNPSDTLSHQASPSPPRSPCQENPPSPQDPPSPRVSPGLYREASPFKTPSSLTTTEPPDLFENPQSRRPESGSKVSSDVEIIYSETSA